MNACVRLLGSIALLGSLLLSTLPASAHVPGVVLSGRGTATIDGVLSPGEWDSAASYPFGVNLLDGGTAPAVLYVMNDATNLYLGVRVNRPSLDTQSAVQFVFDNVHNGVQDSREDVLVLTPSSGAQVGLLDEVGIAGDGTPLDVMVGGTTDGLGRITNNGGFSFYELAHPLSSRDPNDFGLAVGSTVGFVLTVSMCDPTRCIPTSVPPSATSFASFGDIVIAPPLAVNPPSNPVVTPPRQNSPTNTTVVTDKDQCKHGGWRALGFRNQGQCVRSAPH